VSRVKGAVGDAAGVAQPKLLSTAVEQYVGSRKVLAKNRRSTAGEKQGTLKRLIKHLEEEGKKDLSRFSVHDLKRSVLLEFVLANGMNPGKDDIREIKMESDAQKSGKAQKASAPDTDATLQGLSSRTITKAVGHLNDFFIYALANDWAAVNPIDKAFGDAIAGLKADVGQEKAANGYVVFDDSDLKVIFDPKHYLLKNNAADDFWAPLIALFTGARLGEIVTLRADAIELNNDSGIFVMNIATTRA